MNKVARKLESRAEAAVYLQTVNIDFIRQTWADGRRGPNGTSLCNHSWFVIAAKVKTSL